MIKALKSKTAFNPWLLLLFSIPSSITIALTEAEGSANKLALLLLSSFITLLPALGFILLFKPLFDKRKAPWWLVPILAFLSGGLRSGLLWWVNNELGLAQPSLTSRLIVGSLSWGVGLTIMVIIAHGLITLREENQKAKEEIESARERFADLDSQLKWLVEARVNGLSQELAGYFVNLVEKLNQEGLGPSSHRQIAQELRLAAQKYGKARSEKVWNTPKQTGPNLWQLIKNTEADIPLAFAIFFSTAFLNVLRIQGWSIELWGPVLSASVMLIWLPLTKEKPLFQHLAPVLSGLALGMAYLEFDQPSAIAVQAGIATWIWMQVVILISGGIRVIARASSSRVAQLRKEAQDTKAEGEWLMLQLESTNLDIAKYLHAILQTRLMAYAMKLENPKGISQQDLRELQQLLASPLGEFGYSNTNLNEALQELREGWSDLVEIELAISADPLVLTSPTVQVVREALANSVKHGLADKVTIQIQDQGEVRKLVIADNGIGPRTGPSGLGTQICNSLCSSFSLSRNENGGATFTATMPLH